MGVCRETGRPVGEGSCRTSHAHAREESDNGVVPMKRPNNGGPPSAEDVEGSALTEENTAQPNAGRTPSRGTAPNRLHRVRQAAKEAGPQRFTALLHHLTVDLLRAGYYALKRSAAPGVDGVRWEEYETGWKEMRDSHRTLR